MIPTIMSSLFHFVHLSLPRAENVLLLWVVRAARVCWAHFAACVYDTKQPALRLLQVVIYIVEF